MAPLTSVCPRGSVLRRPAPVKAEMHRPAPYGGGPGLDRDCSAEWEWVRANAGGAGHSPALLILGTLHVGRAALLLCLIVRFILSKLTSI